MTELSGYVSPIEVAVALGMNHADESVMADIKDALRFVEPLVEQYCDTDFVSTDDDTEAQLFDGNGSKILSLGKFVREVTLVEAVDLNDNAVEIEYYKLQPTNARRKDEAGNTLYTYLLRTDADVFPIGVANIRVTAKYGPVGVPAAVKQAIIYGVRHYFNLRQQNDVVSQEMGVNRSQTFNHPGSLHYLPRVARTLLGKWRYREV